jgi:predicted nucleic acid-binding protein
MSVKRKELLDAYALLAFLGREPGSEKVKSAIHAARSGRKKILMNEINVGEVYYTTARERSLDQAEALLAHLERLPIEILPNTFAEVLEAARIKARFSVSYADAFAVATAIREDAVILTGDPEFQDVEELVTIEWL